MHCNKKSSSMQVQKYVKYQSYYNSVPPLFVPIGVFHYRTQKIVQYCIYS